MLTRIDRAKLFIERAKHIHSDENYDYSKVVDGYVDNRTKICIIDRSIDENGEEYGEFWITPSNLLKGRKNPATKGKRIKDKKQLSQEEFIARAKEIHKGEDLDYSQTVYKGAHEKIYIIDHSLRPDGNEYGGYWQEAYAHLKGCGHPQKAIDKASYNQRSTTEEFIEKSKIIHANNDYDYSQVEYVTNRTKVKVICNRIGSNGKPHGVFEIAPDNFLQGKGCPKCGNHISKGEDEIYTFLVNKLGEGNVVRGDRTVLEGYEIDIYVPSRKVGIEYNGLKWHSEEFGKDRYYHVNKLEKAEEKGITLLQVFEDDFIFRKNIVFSKLSHILNLDVDKEKVMARKCTVTEISKKEAKAFLDENHIQGFAASTLYIGCFHKDLLIGVMSFKRVEDEWELNRFATDINYVCQGVGGKLFNYFVRTYKPVYIKSFLDRTYENNANNNLYTKLGFRIEKIEKPDYKYTNGHGMRSHKFNFRKQILHRKYGFNLSMTESEMTSKLGYYKIWNCGLIKYVWKSCF